MYVQRFQDRVYHIPDNALPPPHLTTVLSQLQADEVRPSPFPPPLFFLRVRLVSD
jgi:hypothetical protein